MNTFLLILFIIIVIILTITILYIILYNRFTESIIRIQEAEIRIDENIREKYDILNKIISISKNIIEIDDKKFEELLKLKARKISSFDMNRILIKQHNEFLTLYNENIKLREDDEIYKGNKQIDLIDEELQTLINYYNINILNYNKMVKKIPSNIIAKIKKYQEKPYYDLKNMNDTDYEDFKL